MKMKNKEVCIQKKNKLKQQKKNLNEKEFSDLPDNKLKIMVLWILTKIRRIRMNKVKISIKT